MMSLSARNKRPLQDPTVPTAGFTKKTSLSPVQRAQGSRGEGRAGRRGPLDEARRHHRLLRDAQAQRDARHVLDERQQARSEGRLGRRLRGAAPRLGRSHTRGGQQQHRRCGDQRLRLGQAHEAQAETHGGGAGNGG